MGSPTLTHILSRLVGLTKTKSNQWQSCCPCHKGGREANRSFGIREDANNRIVLNCFAGCPKEDVVAALGITLADLMPEGGTTREPEPVDDGPAIEEWTARCEQWVANFADAPAVRTALATALKIPESAFAHFPGLGARPARSPEHPDGHREGECWTFPERNAKCEIIGVSLRFKDGKKKVEEGGRRGLAIPAGWQDRPGPLYLPEGASDVLALTAAGCAAVGRPSVNGGVKLLAELIKAEVPTTRPIIWLGENDRDPKTNRWPGRDESKKAAAKLAAECPEHQILFSLPPNTIDKDIRKWATGLIAEGLQWFEVSDRLRKFLKPEVVQPAKPDDNTPSPEEDTRSRLLVNTNNQKKINDAALLLLAKDPNLYARGNMLVRTIEAPGKIVYRGKDEKGKPIPIMVIPPHARLSPVQIPTLREKISAVANFTKPGRKGDREVDPPDWCVTALHAREEWPNLKNLSALVDYPVLRPDGTIVTERGHDEQTGVFYNHTGAVAVPKNPSRADALAAWERLSEVICDFPFEHDVHKSAWLAAILTPMTRFAFSGCVPVFLIDGNVAGAGKGLLADTISLILTGRPFATMGYVDDQAEMAKRITAIAIEGEQIVLFDNIDGNFGGASIDRALTSLEWSERVLGQSKNIKCPMRIGWYGTGNNVELVGDILRRLCQIRLESPDERPEERRGFKHGDLRAWIMLNRDRLLSDAATILAAYYSAGAPRADLKHWGSFEAWSLIVRQAVVWLGLPDPMNTRDHILADTDTSRAVVRAIVQNWSKIDRDGYGMTSNQIILRVFGDDGKTTPIELRDVADAIKQVNSHPSGRSLGQHFKKHRTTRFGNLFLVALAENRDGVNRWVVRRSDTKEIVGPDSGIAGFAGADGNPILVDESYLKDKTLPREDVKESSKPANPATEGQGENTSARTEWPLPPANPANTPPRPGTGFSALDD
jgi:hypothetical protein